jgi:hypothetical protein
MPARIYGYWYLCIAIGFTLLTLHRAFLGAPVSGSLMRLGIAALFGVLAWFQLRKPAPPS